MEISKQESKRIFECPLFAGVDCDHAMRIFDTHDCSIRFFGDNEEILSPKTPQKYVCILLLGKATVTTPDPGKSTLLRYLSICEPFGVANLFSNSPFISVVSAKGSCKVLFLTEAAIKALLESDASFLYNYLGFLSNRVRYLNQKIGYLTAGSAERRLALYLCSHGKPVLDLPNSLTSLSELLDIGRASLYRAFDKLTEDGYIQKDGRSIRLLNSEALLQAYQ